jgi:hypothetical protein
MIQQSALTLTASDVSGQRKVTLRNVSLESNVGQVVDGLVPILNLNRQGRDGKDLVVEARLEREGRHLHRSELVRDSLRHEDHLVLQPRIMAGGGFSAPVV